MVDDLDDVVDTLTVVEGAADVVGEAREVADEVTDVVVVVRGAAEGCLLAFLIVHSGL